VKGADREDRAHRHQQHEGPGDRRTAARRLQTELDGVYGTNGDVAEYLRVIETFAD